MVHLLYPKPIYPANMPLAELGTAELLLVATVRLFALPLRDPQGDHPDWRDGLISTSLGESGSRAFAGLFHYVVVAARRSLDVRCPHCRSLGEDEGRLLQLIGLLQRRNRVEAAAILADWLPQSAAREALAPACELASGLAEAKLTLPRRHAEAAQPMPGHVHADRGLALVQ